MARRQTREPEIATGVLVLGTIAYFFLCLPAIHSRGYPPIDPFWDGVTLLWPVPILISAYFDSPELGSRGIQLNLYSLVTAFIFSGTYTIMVPRHIDLATMMMGTIFTAPFFYLIAHCVEYASQCIYDAGRLLVKEDSPESGLFKSRFAILCVAGWILLCISIPVGIRTLALAHIRSTAIRQANKDWATNAGFIEYRDFQSFDDCSIEYGFDQSTGLELKRRPWRQGYAEAYNSRTRELIAQNGLPRYNKRSVIPSAEEMFALLNATDLMVVEKFPFDVTEDIRLTMEGSSPMSPSGLLHIRTARTTRGGGSDGSPVSTKVFGDLVIIRQGTKWAGLFLRDGRMIASISCR